MAPIPRITIAAKPLSIITGALFGALSGPKSSPPSNGINATIWGTDYVGTASYLDYSRFNSPSTPSASSSASSTPTSTSPSTPSPTGSSLVYFNTKTKSYTGCDNQSFESTDNVVLMNPLQFGDVKSNNSTCGEWVLVKNRENTEQSALAKVVGVCDECEYGSIDLSIGGLSELVPDMPFENINFDNSAAHTIADLTDPISPLPVASTPISPKDLVNIVWTLSDPPVKVAPLQPKPTATPSTSTSAATTTTTTTHVPVPTSPAPSKQQFSGRATWYSDTTGWCEHSYSQSDMIVAVNESQMGKGKDMCGKKILLTQKGSNVQVVVTVVDMCPSQYCKSGDLDLSQGAFKKFADLGKGVLELSWSWV
ncbi:hypothetical protein BGZ81_007143 [Podila clonocystis]|nr:hypothetical protein BGZ81_007143 [Podila clonocystis]